jgi:hypothetical protein
MEKSGMRLIRAFVADWPVSIPGDEHGGVEYAISRSEWEQNRAVTERHGDLTASPAVIPSGRRFDEQQAASERLWLKDKPTAGRASGRPFSGLAS